MGKLTEESETLVDLLSREGLHPFCAETLDREGTHHPAVEHGVLEVLEIDLGLRRKVTDEAAGKGVAGAGGIHHLLQRPSRSAKRRRHAACSAEGVLTEERCG